jgi:hypothetical protein
MLQDEKIRYQYFRTKWHEFAAATNSAGFTAKQLDALKKLSELIGDLATVVWKEEGEIGKIHF